MVLKDKQFYKFSTLQCNEQLVRYLIQKLSINESSKHLLKQIKSVIKVFVTKLLSKWRDCNYTFIRFCIKNNKWLDESLKFPDRRLPITPKAKRGRPKKLFVESSERSMQRSISSLVSDVSTEELCFAAKSSLVKAGKRSGAQAVQLAVTTSPRKRKTIIKRHSDGTSSTVPLRPYSPNEALSLIVDLGLTKEDYLTMRLGAKERGANIYPSYHQIAEAKKQCYPSFMSITENEAVVSLQDLLDLTVQRLVQVQSDVIIQNLSDDCDTISVFYKWGLDGSGGHSIYKQNFSNNSDYADSNIILSTIVPLEISVQDGIGKKIF